MYLATFIYFLPLFITIAIYVAILRYMKRKVSIRGCQQRVIEQKRRRRELHLIRRVLMIMFILFITGSPYIIYFFLVNSGGLPLLKYGHRISFMFIAFGQGIATLVSIMNNQ